MELPPDKRDYVTAYELASRAKVSPSTVWRLKATGKIPFYQPGGKGSFVRFPPNAIEMPADVLGFAVTPEQTHDRIDVHHSNGEVRKNLRLPGPMPKWKIQMK